MVEVSFVDLGGVAVTAIVRTHSSCHGAVDPFAFAFLVAGEEPLLRVYLRARTTDGTIGTNARLSA